MTMKRHWVVGALSGVALGALTAISTQLYAQSSVEIEFVVPTTIAGDIETGPTGDKVVWTGPGSGNTWVGDCVDPPGERPVQSLTVIDPDGGRATRIGEAMPTSQEGPVQPGTRLVNLVPLGQCNGGIYTKFSGTVD